jgi:copper homeostasis protein
MPNRAIVEICVDCIESAVAADRGRADRIELCSALNQGGLTPSAGLISTVRSEVSIGVFVMIRPHAGNFVCSDDEFKAMERDVLVAKQMGANGIVLGILTEDGRVDVTRTRQLVELGRPLKVTFHRAFDVTRDLSESLEDVIRTGAGRVLTSGGEQTAELGAKKIADLSRQVGERITVMAGSGVNERNARQLVSDTGVREIHANLRKSVPSPMRYRNDVPKSRL